MATDLYTRAIAPDESHGAIMRKVWAPTPWVINVETGSVGGDRWRDICDWCHENFGPESSPIHEREGRWHSGSATIYGNTWFGFATETDMIRFQERWGGGKEN